MSKCSFCDKPCENAWCEFGGNVSEKTIKEKFEEIYEQNPLTNVEVADEYYAFETGYKTAKAEFESDEECWLISMESKDEQLKELEEKLKRAVEVIKFYAEPRHWGTDKPGMQTSIDPCDQTHYDDEYSNYGIRGGKKAREFLKSLEEI